MTVSTIERFPIKTLLYFTKIINIILQWQQFPVSWKPAKVTSILKPHKSVSLPEPYRPISLLSSLSKIMEAVLLTRIN
ncbi:putative RNA-directed DNA polymerase from transposon X-element, partial [Stegodyphus mimosarum]